MSMKKIIAFFYILSLAFFLSGYAQNKENAKIFTSDELSIKIAPPSSQKKGLSPIMVLNFSQTGVASWYGKDFHGKLTASGDIFNQNSMTAAHRHLPLNSVVKVTNLNNNKCIVVLINDRGPYSKKGRIIDLSKQAATMLGFDYHGLTKVKIEYLHDATLDYSTKIAYNKRRKLHKDIEKFSINQLKQKVNLN